LLDDRRIRIWIRIRIHTSDKWVRIREVQKHVDPDSDQWSRIDEFVFRVTEVFILIEKSLEEMRNFWNFDFRR
jgi:hypothetical protein